MRYSVKFLTLVMLFFVIPCSFVHSFSRESINACIDKFINDRKICKHLRYKGNGEDIVSRRLLFICCEFFRLVEDYCVLSWPFNEEYAIENILLTIDDLINSFAGKYASDNWETVSTGKFKVFGDFCLVVYEWPNASFIKKLISSVYEFKKEGEEIPRIKIMRKFVNKCIHTHLVGGCANICNSICVVVSYILFGIDNDQCNTPCKISVGLEDMIIRFDSKGVRLFKRFNKQKLIASESNVFLKRSRSI